jgi:hypothetical protein
MGPKARIQNAVIDAHKSLEAHGKPILSMALVWALETPAQKDRQPATMELNLKCATI